VTTLTEIEPDTDGSKSIIIHPDGSTSRPDGGK